MRRNRLMQCTRAEVLSTQGQRYREERSWSSGLLCSECFLCMGVFLHKGQLAALEERLGP